MTKTETYEELLAQLASLCEGETDETSVLANAAALLHATFDWHWTGFYLVRPLAGDGSPAEELRLGPFQGSVACMHIGYGRGVCGTAWKTNQTQVVPDVDQFPGHIACSSLSRSEIVVPMHDASGRVTGVLDIDSRHLDAFDNTDRQYLERAVDILTSSGGSL